MRFRVRVPVTVSVPVCVVAATVLLSGCSRTPAEQLEDWYGSGGEAQMRKLTEDAGRVNEVSMRTIDVQGPACQDLLAQTAKAEKLDPIPDEGVQRYWKEALGGFRRGRASAPTEPRRTTSPRSPGASWRCRRKASPSW